MRESCMFTPLNGGPKRSHDSAECASGLSSGRRLTPP
jgi:hypothetical protein